MEVLDKYNEIIDFAISREKDAVQFYRDLQKMTEFSVKKKILHDFEVMEMDHVKVLEKIREADIDNIDIPDVEDLHISEYLVNVAPTSEMSYQDILVTAMKREESSYKLYSSLAGKSSNKDIKKVFSKLASEEIKHKLIFEKMYDDEILTHD